MASRYVVRPGDTIDGIAEAHGLAPDVVWAAPENAALRALRGDRNVLQAGDLVVLPALRPKKVPVASGSVAVFRRRGVPSLLRVRFTLNGRPRRALAWNLVLKDGARLSGWTDDDGVLQTYVHPSNKQCTLTLGDDEPYELLLGFLDPIDSPLGVQQRLGNLGFPCRETGAYDEPTLAALCAFQRAQGLVVTGEFDGSTRRALDAVHKARE